MRSSLRVPPPGPHTVGVFRKLAAKRPDLCDGSGRGYWPTSAKFPTFVALTVLLLQRWGEELILSKDPFAEHVVAARMHVMRLAYFGDLGEDHAKLFLADHPGLRESPTDSPEFPFSRFCGLLTSFTNPAEAAGALWHNETGSTEGITELGELGLVTKGEWYRAHLIEEPEHGKAAEEVAKVFRDSAFWHSFQVGAQKHADWYLTALE
jgi:hypothetical protein